MDYEREKINWDALSEEQKLRERQRNNPAAKRVGPYTGRCERCHSDKLWDDATWYGCNNCGASWPN